MKIIFDKCWPNNRGTVFLVERDIGDQIYRRSIAWLRANISKEDYFTQEATTTNLKSCGVSSTKQVFLVQFRNDDDATLWRMRF